MTQPTGAEPPTPPTQTYQPYQPYPAVAYLPEHPLGTTVLVLGILALVTGLTGPFAWYYGVKAEREIRAGGQRYSNESQIQIGKILGIVGSVLMGLSVLFFVLYFVVMVMIVLPMLSHLR